jgi:hypothetical protein
VLSHEIEAPIGVMLTQAERQMESSQATYASDLQVLTSLLVGLSGLSLRPRLLDGFTQRRGAPG